MLAWIKIAPRNLLRNSRRSLFTISAIALGFAAVSVFGGFTEYIFTSLEDAHIYAQGNGHLMIFKKGFLAEGKLDPAGYLLSQTELEAIKQVLRNFSSVQVATPQLHISGLLSNGEISTIFRAVGRIPSEVQAIRRQSKGLIARLNLYSGKPLEDDVLYGIGLSSGLARLLNLRLGSAAIAMAPTISGQINALDVEVFQTFEATVEVLNDMLMIVPLTFAQSLYDTSSVDRLAVLLRGTGNAEAVKAALSGALENRRLAVEVKTWRELDPLYTQTKEMFDIIFLFIFVIVFVVVVMSIVNTMSMAIVERTREIGTLRALGTTRRGIVNLFALESAILGGLGCVLGMILTLTSWLIINVLVKPTWIPPIITKRIPLEVYLVPEYLAYSSIFLILLSVVAAIFPARKAGNQEIVDALGHI